MPDTLTLTDAFDRLEQARTRAELRAVKAEIEQHDHAGTLYRIHADPDARGDRRPTATRATPADLRRIYDRYNAQLTRLPA